MIGSVRHLKEFQQFHGSFLSLMLSLSGNICRNAYIFESGEFRKKLVELKNKSDVPVSETRQLSSPQFACFRSVIKNRTGVRPVERPENLKQCSLSGPRLHRYRNNFPVADFKIYSFENLKVHMILLFRLPLSSGIFYFPVSFRLSAP
jgi:hypothetical protein